MGLMMSDRLTLAFILQNYAGMDMERSMEFVGFHLDEINHLISRQIPTPEAVITVYNLYQNPDKVAYHEDRDRLYTTPTSS